MRKKINILWLTENYYPSRGGMAESCDRIVRGLRGEGISVYLVHFSRRLLREKIEEKKNGFYIGWPMGNDPAHMMNCVWNYVSRELTGKITHVAAFGGILPMVSGPVYAAWLRVPLITVLRGNDFDVGIFSPKRQDVLREALARSEKVCVVSKDKREKISAFFPGIRAVCVPNGIDLSIWEPLPSNLKKAIKWKKNNVKPGKRVLGLLGQIKQKKGGLFFLKNLLNSGVASDFHVLFVGDLGEDVTSWLEENRDKVDSSHVPFLDRLELLSWYPVCDLAVIPSFYDGFPNVLLETAGLGIPLIAAKTGGMNDCLKHEKHGFLFPPGDSHELKRALFLAREASGKTLEKMGRHCRSMVEKKYGSSSEIKKYVSLFEETLSRKRMKKTEQRKKGRKDESD